MTRHRVLIEEVLVYLGVENRAAFLQQLRSEGLFEHEEIEPEEAEELRLARLLMEDMGVNAAGVDVALHLRRRLFALEARARALAEALTERNRSNR